MQITYALTLPRDVKTVPVVRRLCKGAMLELGVETRDIGDVSLALTEACANVIEHSSDDDDEYQVIISVSEQTADIRVIDRGRGFDAAQLAAAETHGNLTAERGRGITLMNALVDQARFESAPEAGTVVHLRKTLRLEDDSLFRLLTERYASRVSADGQDASGT
jgi:serine/threonine-protein kinase RsbW